MPISKAGKNLIDFNFSVHIIWPSEYEVSSDGQLVRSPFHTAASMS